MTADAVDPTFQIPDVGQLSLEHAALTWGKRGFYVLPARPDGKSPGSYVGKGWPDQSTTDPEQIALWWDRWPNANIAIHTGASGLTFFDLDVDEIPEELAWLRTGIVQFSRAEIVNSERGHYGFNTGDGIFTNGKLKLTDGTHVGEIRSGNTVIIVAPSKHPHAETTNAEYRWRTDDIDAPIPKLPSEARKYLRLLGVKKPADPNDTAVAGWCVEATDDTVNEAIAQWKNESRPKALRGPVNKVRNAESGTRDEVRDQLRVVAGEARIGFYPLADVIEQIRNAMIESYKNRGEPEKFDHGEFWRLVKNGVGYAMGRTLDEIKAEANRDYPPDFEKDVAKQVHWLEVRAEAQRRINAKNHEPLARSVTNLTEFLAQPPNPTPMRIDNLMPAGGRVVFSAPYKAGKTTAVGNLIRSLVDGDPFLGTFPVNKSARRLVLIDNELSSDMVRDWLLKQGIRNTDAVADVICLRGEISSFDILHDQRRSEWAACLRDIGCDYVILDCLRPVLDAHGLDENHDAGKFFTAFDELLSEAGTHGDAMIVHHMGHTGERSRGDSRIQDWPDAIWKLVRENPDDDFSPRYFSATGRDVKVEQGLLRYNPANRHLTYRSVNRTDARKQRRLDAAVSEITRILTDHKNSGGTGVSQNQLITEVTKATGIGKPAVKAALDFGVNEGALIVFSGLNRSKNYAIVTEMPNFNG
ncbi:MAG: bifunctional DNA primase/polymerase [Actinomycetia bacterium]|nr:bifunctional DNA primase/polymerase [Actinomycetes bacterium]